MKITIDLSEKELEKLNTYKKSRDKYSDVVKKLLTAYFTNRKCDENKMKKITGQNLAAIIGVIPQTVYKQKYKDRRELMELGVQKVIENYEKGIMPKYVNIEKMKELGLIE